MYLFYCYTEVADWQVVPGFDSILGVVYEYLAQSEQAMYNITRSYVGIW